MTPVVRRRRLGALFLLLAVYWIALVIVAFGPGVEPVWLAAHAPDNTSDIAINAGTAGLALTVTQYGQTTWAFAASLTALLFWVIGAPVAMSFWWMNRKAVAEPEDDTLPAELGTGAAAALETRPRDQVNSTDRR